MKNKILISRPKIGQHPINLCFHRYNPPSLMIFVTVKKGIT